MIKIREEILKDKSSDERIYLESNLAICIRYCLTDRQTKLLYNKFNSSGANRTETLLHYILKHTTINIKFNSSVTVNKNCNLSDAVLGLILSDALSKKEYNILNEEFKKKKKNKKEKKIFGEYVLDNIQIRVIRG